MLKKITTACSPSPNDQKGSQISLLPPCRPSSIGGLEMLPRVKRDTIRPIHSLIEQQSPIIKFKFTSSKWKNISLSITMTTVIVWKFAASNSKLPLLHKLLSRHTKPKLKSKRK